jgi:hypothetical protein
MPCEAPFVIVRLIVTFGSQQFTTYRTIKASEQLPSGTSCPIQLTDPNADRTSVNPNPEGRSVLSLSPNPTQGSFTALFYLPNDDDCQITISNWAGKTMYAQHLGSLSRGFQNISVSTKLSGLNVVTIQGKNSRFTSKIFVNN